RVDPHRRRQAAHGQLPQSVCAHVNDAEGTRPSFPQSRKIRWKITPAPSGVAGPDTRNGVASGKSDTGDDHVCCTVRVLPPSTSNSTSELRTTANLRMGTP